MDDCFGSYYCIFVYCYVGQNCGVCVNLGVVFDVDQAGNQCFLGCDVYWVIF